jgi:predicted N-acetyltransferase YhbS
MTVKIRHYNGQDDYNRIAAFLIEHYLADNTEGNPGAISRGNWLEPAWEYMHGHPYLDASALGKIGIWEEAGEIIAVCRYESRLGEAFFEYHPAYHHLREAMLDHAEQNLLGISEKDGRKYLCAFINDNNPEFQALVQARGYEKDPEGMRPLYRFDIPHLFPSIPLPDGFRLTSLAEECDWAKVQQVLWRGFDHGDDVPMHAEELESRRKMFDTPKARRDLKIAAVAPNGDFVAFCGMFYEPTRRFAYVEPVATDPRYRCLGLGKAEVLEGIRRCEVLGAMVAYVGSDQLFYQAIGFKKVYNSECWVKYPA